VGYENALDQRKGAIDLAAHRDVVIPKEVIREIEIYYLNRIAALLAKKR
jgi:hypothetical protein